MLYISAAIKPDFARGLFFSDSINLISKEKESKHSSKRDLFLKILEIITVFFVFFKNPPPFNKTQKIKFITTNWNQPFEVLNLLLLHANNQCWMPLHLTNICSQHYWNIIINIAHEYILHISLQKKQCDVVCCSWVRPNKWTDRVQISHCYQPCIKCTHTCMY